VLNTLTGKDFMISGQDLKNSLQAYDQNKLAVSADGQWVGWNAGGVVTGLQQNNASGMFAVLVQNGVLHG
jgi:hypothetical protein